MSASCCEIARPPRAGACPMSGSPGSKVSWRTVAALTAAPLPHQQQLWLCREPSCDTVYFGTEGARFGRGELKVEPGFKVGGDDALLCYCFGYRRGDLARETAQNGATAIPETIQARVVAGDCACEVRNPAGRCCLGEVRRAERELAADSGPAPS